MAHAKRTDQRPAKGDTVTATLDGDTIQGTVKVRTGEMLALEHDDGIAVITHDAVNDWEPNMDKTTY